VELAVEHFDVESRELLLRVLEHHATGHLLVHWLFFAVFDAFRRPDFVKEGCFLVKGVEAEGS
jgi:hypothetical protein